MSAVLEEVLCVERHNAGLVGLRHVGKDGVYHRHQHPILVGVSGVLNYRHDVCSLLGNVQQVPRKEKRLNLVLICAFSNPSTICAKKKNLVDLVNIVDGIRCLQAHIALQLFFLIPVLQIRIRISVKSRSRGFSHGFKSALS